MGTAYAQFNRGIFAGAPCVWIPACRYTSQMVGVCCRSTIRTVPSLDFARRCVSSRAPLKNVKGADTVNCVWPPCCSTHCSRVPWKHCQFLRSRYTITTSFHSHGRSRPVRDSNVGIQPPPYHVRGAWRIRGNPVGTSKVCILDPKAKDQNGLSSCWRDSKALAGRDHLSTRGFSRPGACFPRVPWVRRERIVRWRLRASGGRPPCIGIGRGLATEARRSQEN